MSESIREKFEKAILAELKVKSCLSRDDAGYADVRVENAWFGYQSCAAHYEATINTLNDAITEDKILAAHAESLQQQVLDLLALVEKQREALSTLRNITIDTPLWPIACLHANQALALNIDSVKLVDLDGKYFQDEHKFVKIGTQYESDPDSFKLYRIETTISTEAT